MRHRRIYISFLLALSLMVFSCSKETEEMACSGKVIGISSPLMGEGATRGADNLTSSNLTNFSLCAIWNYDGVSQNRWYLTNQAVAKDPSKANPWFLNPTAYWPVIGDLSFFMYAPGYDPYSQISFIPSNTGFPQVDYTPSTLNVNNQLDFLVGEPVMHYTYADGAVPANFNHALTQVLFYGKYSGTLPPGCFLLIDEIRVKGIVGTKSASYAQTSPYISWEDESGRTADSTYVLSRSEGHLRRVEISNVRDTILCDSNGRLYLLPQTLGANASLEVVYGFYTNTVNAPLVVAQFIKDVPLPQNQVWPVGKTVKYYLMLDIGISNPLQLTSTITDWVVSGNSHSEVEYE